MDSKRIIAALSLVSCVFIDLQADDFLDADLQDILDMKSEVKTDVGSLSGTQNISDSRSPVDVITSEMIASSGLYSLSDVLRYFVAGLNAPQTSVADGSDHVRTFTLRGMGPDQILVLVNGKRLHTSSLLHVNSTIGRGSSNVDLDTIAINSIERIDILRDGAAAQYGSDAISGVINIVLKGIGHQNSLGLHAGQRAKKDGQKLYADLFVSKGLKYDGFVNFAISAEDQEQTQRAGVDNRLALPTVKTHAGLPDSKNYKLALNSEIPTANNLMFYTHSLLNYRDSQSSAFFRPSDHDVQTTSIYPNGFLPMINAKILDYSVTLGANGTFTNGIFWDLSNTYGYNKIEYYVDKSMNYSLGAFSPRSFYNGSLSFIQNTTNLDFKKSIDKLNIAAGLEYRYENYQIKAGDTESYAGSFSQGFAGYGLDNETDSSRNNYALYLNAVYNVSKKFSIEGALRYEDFSDFGSTSNVKLSSKYEPIDKVSLRTSLSTGFRAPSLAQSYYSQNSTFASGTEILTQGTFRPEDEVSQAFGAQALSAEKSKHFTAGIVYKPYKNSFIMFDYFYIDVKDRIMLSDDMRAQTAEQSAVLQSYGVDKIRFFTNAVDTSTKGFDLKYNQKFTFDDSSEYDLTLWYNYSKNKIESFNNNNISRINSYEQIDRIENGQPKSALRILNSYKVDNLTSTLNINRYGSYKQVISDVAYNFESAWTVDIDLSYSINKTLNVAIGSINLFDKYPNKWDGLSGDFYGYDGIKPYSRYSPFGYSGAYYYFRTNILF